MCSDDEVEFVHASWESASKRNGEINIIPALEHFDQLEERRDKTANDAAIATHLQAEFDHEAAILAIHAQEISAHCTSGASSRCAQAPVNLIVDSSPSPRASKKRINDANSQASQHNCKRRAPPEHNLQSPAQTVGSSATCRMPVKLLLAHRSNEVVMLQMDSKCKLMDLFKIDSVVHALSESCGKKHACRTPGALAKRFELVRTVPDTKVYSYDVFRVTSLQAVFGAQGGVLRVRPCHVQPNQRVHRSLHPNSRAVNSVSHHSSQSGDGTCDAVHVIRLRTKFGNEFIGSPIVHIKNLNCDMGQRVSEAANVRATVENAPEAKEQITANVRSSLEDMARPYKMDALSLGVEHLCDKVLDMSTEAVRHDPLATAALNARTPYASTATLIYDASTTLPRHVDACGGWVVLFSFGSTVDFYAGEKTIRFETGDVLVFNGSKMHNAMHGIDKVYPWVSHQNGKRCKLPSRMEYLSKVRVSVQARQGDPP